ncbi:MAG: tol-pal system YbgF family protein [Myxococcota bacterium]|nr:tetratricopeptide repeat protein [Myxococcota bacterium]
MTAAFLLCSMIAVNGELERGHRAFENLKYEQALEHFTRSLAAAENTAERVDAYVYIGMSRFELGDEPGARQAFREALALDRKAALSPLASPKIESAFADERARLVANDPLPPTVTPAPPPEPVPVTATAPPPAVATRSHVPTIVAAAAGVALITAGILVGISARRAQDDAEAATFASDAKGLDDKAHSRARTANILYGAGGALGAFALVYEIAF